MCLLCLADVLRDDIDEAVKKRRLQEVIDTFHAVAAQKNAEEIGNTHLVLVEGVRKLDYHTNCCKTSRKSDTVLKGRSDTAKKVIFPDTQLPDLRKGALANAKPGDYVIVRITGSTGMTLTGEAVGITSMVDWYTRFRQGNELESAKEAIARTIE